MRVKQKLMYMVLGGVLVFAGYILASFAPDSVAQSGVQDVTFGKVTCSSLDVVGNGGKVGVRLANNEHGGFMGAQGKDGKSMVLLYNNKNGGYVSARGKYGGQVLLYNTEYGGSVSAKGKGFKGLVSFGIKEHGGVIQTFDRHGQTSSLP